MSDRAEARGAARPESRPEQELVLIANARVPSQRAQTLQVVQMAGAFSRAGVRTTLLHASRRDTPELPAGSSVFDWYRLGEGARPEVRALPCLDWIDCVPRSLQFLPARAQELSFARRASREVNRRHPAALVLSRELETAWDLVRRQRGAVFLEVHRVPGGRLRRALLTRAGRGAAGVVAISSGVRDDLLELGLEAEGITVAHDGYEPSRFQGLPARAEARALLDVDPGRPLVVYTGGLLAWKGVDVLVQAASELPEVDFVIAGGMDADVELLRARAAQHPNVRLDGFQPPERVALYLVAGDLGVVPNRSTPAISSRYTSPLKVFEAKACGLPLVVSDLPSLRDVLEPDEACFVAPDDPRALAAGLRALLDDEGLRAELSTRTRERGAQHTWDARAARLLEWMRERAA